MDLHYYCFFVKSKINSCIFADERIKELVVSFDFLYHFNFEINLWQNIILNKADCF